MVLAKFLQCSGLLTCVLIVISYMYLYECGYQFDAVLHHPNIQKGLNLENLLHSIYGTKTPSGTSAHLNNSHFKFEPSVLEIESTQGFIFHGTDTRVPHRNIPLWSTLSKFKYRFGARERRELLHSILLLNTTCTALTMDCIMAYGTLLGSYRYHNMLPWDHDFDVIIHEKDRPRLRSELERLGTIFDVQNDIMKFTFGKTWTTYLDIYNYRHFNATHINILYDHEYRMIVNKSWIWPLKALPFAGMWIPAPCESWKLLKIWYSDLDVCEATRAETWLPSPNRINCSVLDYYYPHIVRHNDESGMWSQESLLFENEKLYSLNVSLCEH